MGEGQRERETQNLKQVLGSEHRARRGARTHQLRGHDLSRGWTLHRLSHPGAPPNFLKVCLLEIFPFAFYGNAQIVRIKANNDRASLREEVSLGESLPSRSPGSEASRDKGGVPSGRGTLLPAGPSATQYPYLPTPLWPRMLPAGQCGHCPFSSQEMQRGHKPSGKAGPPGWFAALLSRRWLDVVAKVRPIIDGVPVLPLS